MPRAVIITTIDHQRGDFEEALAACREAFGESVAPLYLPVNGADGTTAGLIGLLSQRFYDYSGGRREEKDPDPGYADRVEELRGELIEGIIQESEDETLMDRYLSGEEIDAKVLVEDLEKAVALGSFYPVLTAAAISGIGLEELLEIMTQAFPSPREPPLRAAAGRGGQDRLRPLRGPDQPGPGVLRHAAPRRQPARVRPRNGRARPRRPRHRRADRRADLAAGQDPAADLLLFRRRYLRGGQARHGRVG